MPPPPPPPRPAAPVVVQVVAKHGGFSRAILFMLGLFLFAAVFVIGLLMGTFGTIAAGEVGPFVLEQPWRQGGSQRIAVVPVSGTIDDRRAELVRQAVQRVIADRSFVGVILRVDSPGGGVSPSDLIWREVQRLRERGLPVVASFGGVAASGGYYVSCGCDSIVAEPTCVTGSIGVIAQVFTMKGLVDKVGIAPVTLVATGSPDKDVANDLFRTWNEADRAKIQGVLDAAYARFNALVKQGRARAIPDSRTVDALANGAIFTADQAVANRLVDSIGYLDDAVAVAEQLAGVPGGSTTVVRLVEPPSLFGALGGPAARATLRSIAQTIGLDEARTIGTAPPTEGAETAAMVRDSLAELGRPRPMYLMW